MQSAEDYVLSHTVERLYVTDLCEAAGVSERTLQYAFKEVMGMTPVAYLICSVMRHSSWETTRKHYAPGDIQKDAEILKAKLTIPPAT